MSLAPDVIYELQDSMSGSVTNETETGESREVKRRFLIGRCLGFNNAVAMIEPYAPAYVTSDQSGIYWVRKKLDVTGVGNRYFDCTATYNTLVPKQGQGENGGGGGQQPLPGSVSWDTTGTTERVYQAFSEEGFAVSEANAPSFECAINVNGTSVEGLDVVRPAMRYSETWVLPSSLALSESFVAAVHRLTGTVNANTFRPFEPGEALFMGGRCQIQGDQPFAQVTFDFEARPNEDWYSDGIGFTIPKEGWEYIWVRYTDDVDSNSLVRRPRYIYKNVVYKKADWSGLLIAGSSTTVGRPRQPVPPVDINAFFNNPL